MQDGQSQAQPQGRLAIQESGLLVLRQVGHIFEIGFYGIGKLAAHVFQTFALHSQVEVHADCLPVAGTPPP